MLPDAQASKFQCSSAGLQAKCIKESGRVRGQTFSSNSVTNAPRRLLRRWLAVFARENGYTAAAGSIKIPGTPRPGEIIFDSNLINGTGMQSIYLHLASTSRGDSIVGTVPLAGPHRFHLDDVHSDARLSFEIPRGIWENGGTGKDREKVGTRF